jgi:hypothetical protein
MAGLDILGILDIVADNFVGIVAVDIDDIVVSGFVGLLGNLEIGIVVEIGIADILGIVAGIVVADILGSVVDIAVDIVVDIVVDVVVVETLDDSLVAGIFHKALFLLFVVFLSNHYILRIAKAQVDHCK